MTHARRAASLRGIYVIVNDGARTIEIARGALAGGARIVQYRAKRGVNLVALRELRDRTRDRNALLVLNDDWHAAREYACDGVHLGPGDAGFSSVPEIRGVWPDAVIGLSCGTEEEMRDAHLAGADYAGVGAIFATGSKGDAGEPIGIAGLRRVAAAAPLAVAAIGGICAQNLASIARTGVAMAAVISAVADAPDAREATRELVTIWERT